MSDRATGSDSDSGSGAAGPANAATARPASRKRSRKKHLAFGVEGNARKYRLRLARYAAMRDTLVAFYESRGGVNAERPVRLLDAGAGNGRSMLYLDAAGVAGGFEMHAIEYDPPRARGLERSGMWASVSSGDLSRGLGGFEDGTFDVVLCEQVLEHLHDPERLLAEVARVLTPGGMLIAGVPTFPPGLSHIRGSVVPLLDNAMGRERGHVQVFTARSFKRRIESVPTLRVDELRGFRIVSGGPLSPLENTAWWYRLNRRLGAAAPGLCTEVQAVAYKR